MQATIAATIATLQVIGFCHYHKAILIKIKVFMLNQRLVHETYLLVFHLY